MLINGGKIMVDVNGNNKVNKVYLILLVILIFVFNVFSNTIYANINSNNFKSNQSNELPKVNMDGIDLDNGILIVKFVLINDTKSNYNYYSYVDSKPYYQVENYIDGKWDKDFLDFHKTDSITKNIKPGDKILFSVPLKGENNIIRIKLILQNKDDRREIDIYSEKITLKASLSK
jgi:hypothetical protein